MLMVVFGAGASYDSVPSCPPEQSVHSYAERPPLADQLFDDRPEFINAMKSFRDCLPIIPLLRHRRNGLSVEQVLQSLQAEAHDYPKRYKQLAAIRYYLQFMLSVCDMWWDVNVAKGITNHVTLLDQIERWRKADEQVCLVTFNYDKILEKALSSVGVAVQNLSDYISHDRYKLIKLHGSVDWAREVEIPIENVTHMSSWDHAHTLINRAAEIKISQKYQMVSGIPIAQSGDIALFPALAIPVETKIDFECPAEHLDSLRSMIPQIDKLLLIGWRASEQPFLQLLAENLRQEIRGLVVAGRKEDAQVTIENVRRAGVKGEYLAAEGGFTEFIVNREADEFLRH